MDARDRLILHQIHPIKILIDVVSVIIALVLLWQEQWLVAAVVLLIPRTWASMVIMNRADLSRLAETRLGRYARRYLTRPVEFGRSVGVAVMLVGAWFHQPVILAAGLVVIAGSLGSGLLFPGGPDEPESDARL
jgi:hypothetical protein